MGNPKSQAPKKSGRSIAKAGAALLTAMAFNCVNLGFESLKFVWDLGIGNWPIKGVFLHQHR
jgi:hypothetical protein